MLLNEIIEEQHALHKWRRPTSTRYCGTNLIWAVEVERNHTDRLLSLYGSVFDQSLSFASVSESTIGAANFCGASSRNSTSSECLGFSSLIFSNMNMIAEKKLPPEAFRSVHRMFFVPRCLFDPVGIVNHTDFLSIFQSSSFFNGINKDETKNSPPLCRKNDQNLESDNTQNRVILKIQTSPKNLEKYLTEMIRINLDGKYLLRLDFDNYQNHNGNKSSGTFESECRDNNAAVSEITVNENTKKKNMGIRDKENDLTNHGNQNSFSNQKVGNTHTHLLQCVYGVDDGVFRWGIVNKEDSVRYRLTAESINDQIENERRRRFVRDDYLRSQNIPDIENVLPKTGESPSNYYLTNMQNSDRNAACRDLNCITNGDEKINSSNGPASLSELKSESPATCDVITPYDCVSAPNRKIDVNQEKYDPQKINNISRSENNDLSTTTRETNKKLKSFITDTKFSPASRAYYKMSEVKEFYFPLWGWSWPRGHFDFGCESGLKDEDCNRNGEREKDGVVGYGCCAVDVGSSPGGWTQCLAAHCSSVISIDSGLLRDDVLRLENVQYVQGLIQSEAAQAALRNAKNWRDRYRVESDYGELERNGERFVRSDKEIEIEKRSSEGGVDHLYLDRAESKIQEGSNNQDYETMHEYQNRNNSENDATDGRVAYGRKRSKYENMNENHMNEGAERGGGGGGRRRSVSGGGLRVAVCDVNLGASAAASLLRDFVLPHMVTACKCICDRKDRNATQSNAGKMYPERCPDLWPTMGSNDDLCSLGTDVDDEDCSTGDASIGATECTTKCGISDTTSNKSNQSDPSTNRGCLCGGYVVLTLKLPKGAKNAHAQSAADSARTVLTKAGCWDFKIIHLNANSSNERTLLCRFGGKETKDGNKC